MQSKKIKDSRFSSIGGGKQCRSTGVRLDLVGQKDSNVVLLCKSVQASKHLIESMLLVYLHEK